MSWYRIASSSEIKRNKIVNLDKVSERLIAFRDPRDVIKVASAFCPHLGAHLGVGGRFEKGEIVCPFHAWRFDSEGQCIKIPYCEKIPKKAMLKMFRVVDVAGQVFVHFGSELEPFDATIFQGKKCIAKKSIVVDQNPDQLPIVYDGGMRLTTYTPLMNNKVEKTTITLLPRKATFLARLVSLVKAKS